jgi:hypothetical protein
MGEQNKTQPDLKPTDIHANSEGTDEPTVKDIHANGGDVTNGDIHANGEPAN